MPPDSDDKNDTAAVGPQHHIPHYTVQQPYHQEDLFAYQQPHNFPHIAVARNHYVGNHAINSGVMMHSNANGSGPRRRPEDEDHLNNASNNAARGTSGIQPTPLFERLVTEEVQELKAYARIIESQNRRLAELERVHGDLETRLEQESRARQQLEGTLEERERQWNDKYASLEKDRDHWKEVVQIEQTKNSRLIEQVVRKDQDIQKMLQRKYDQPRGDFNQASRNMPFRSSGNFNTIERERNTTPNSTSRSPLIENHKSPHEILVSNGSAEDVRARNVAQSLMDFFSMK